jgi:hypothetical protein
LKETNPLKGGIAQAEKMDVLWVLVQRMAGFNKMKIS